MNKFAIYALKVMGKMSQADLARNAKLSRQTVSNFFHEKTIEPDRNTIAAIAEGLNIPLDTFYRESGVLPPQEDSAPVIEATAHVMKGLSESDQADVLEYARLREKLAEERRRQDSAGSKRITTPR